MPGKMTHSGEKGSSLTETGQETPNTRDQMPGKVAKPTSPGSGWVHWPGPISCVSLLSTGGREAVGLYVSVKFQPL